MLILRVVVVVLKFGYCLFAKFLDFVLFKMFSRFFNPNFRVRVEVEVENEKSISQVVDFTRVLMMCLIGCDQCV